MRVLHVISGRMYGGGQRVALDLCFGLRESGAVQADLGHLGCSVEALRSNAAFVVPYDGNYASNLLLSRLWTGNLIHDP